MASSRTYLPIAGQYDLYRGLLKDTGVPLPISAAGQQASRLAACIDGSFVFSTNANVFRLNCSPNRKRTRPPEPILGNEHSSSSHLDANGIHGDAVVSATTDDYIVPKPFSNVLVERFMPHCTHQSEVQSVTAEGSRVASVDMYGRCVITVEKPSPSGSEVSAEERKYGNFDSFVLAPASLRGGDPGWAGVALKQKDPMVSAIVRQFYRDITFYDRDVPVRTINSILPLQAVKFCGEGNLMTVAAGSDLSFYDFRAAERSGCLGQKTAGTGPLLTLDVSSDGTIVATAGMDRTLHVFDVRTMTVRERWPGCLKYECAAAVLSDEMQGMAYVCSVDNEVACGAWSSEMADYLRTSITVSESLMISGANTKSPRRAFGFRGDARLSGIAKRNLDGEELGALSEGAFYLLRRKRE